MHDNNLSCIDSNTTYLLLLDNLQFTKEIFTICTHKTQTRPGGSRFFLVTDTGKQVEYSSRFHKLIEISSLLYSLLYLIEQAVILNKLKTRVGLFYFNVIISQLCANSKFNRLSSLFFFAIECATNRYHLFVRV